jgi:hypothetical protein
VAPPGQYGSVTASGQVRNTGSVAVKYVKVTVGLYDADGKLLAVGDGFAKLDQIPPGGSAPFSVDFSRTVKQVPPTFEVYAAGQQAQ